MADCDEHEVEQLKSALVRKEARTGEAQREIHRLRAVVRSYNRIEAEIVKPDYEKLFELWSGNYGLYPAGALAKCKSLGKKDTMSFKGFCAGFLAAAKLLEEG